MQSTADWFVVRVILVDHYEVCDFHDTFLSSLEAVATAWRNHVDNKVNDIVNFDFLLSDTDSLDHDCIKARMFTEELNFTSI